MYYNKKPTKLSSLISIRAPLDYRRPRALNAIPSHAPYLASIPFLVHNGARLLLLEQVADYYNVLN